MSNYNTIQIRSVKLKKTNEYNKYELFNHQISSLMLFYDKSYFRTQESV